MKLLLATLAIVMSTVAQQPNGPAGAAVIFAGDTLFVLRAPLGPFTADARAAAVTARIEALAAARQVPADTILVADSKASTELTLRDTVFMTVLDGDVGAAREKRLAQARAWAGLINMRVAEARAAAAPRALLRDLALAAFATAVLVLLLYMLRFAFPRVYATANRVRRLHTRLETMQALRLISPDSIADALVSAARLLRVALTVLLFYIYVPLVLSFFPLTRALSRRIVGYAVTPFAHAWTAFVAFLPNVFYIAAIVVITVYLLKFARLFFDAIERGAITFENFHRDWARPTYKMARFFVIAFALVVVFPYLPGSQSEAFKGVSLFLGVLFSLGSSSAIGNAVAGVVLTYTRSFQVGDRVQVGTTLGDVTEKTLLVTRIRTIKNEDVTVPNGVVLSGQVVNYSALASERGLILHTTVTIGYDAPWRKVHELLIEAATKTAYILPTPAPFVLQTSLDDFFISYQINAVTDRADLMASIYSELHQAIQDSFIAGGVEILSPHYAQLRDGSRSTVAAEHLPKDYRPRPIVIAVDRGGGGGDDVTPA
ncbi:MAG: mechanosensitive ion channel family protein [Gemmatimonadaceae bacterium]